MTKTYRALLTSGDQLQIPLRHVGKGKGFRIKNLQVMPYNVADTTTHECSVQIWKQKQSSVIDEIDFSDTALVGAAYYVRTTSGGGTPTSVTDNQTVIFDNEVFNQDIFVTYLSGQTNQQLNYYLELEEVNMTEGFEAVVNFDALISRT